MKEFFRRLIGDKTWYSFWEYESLPTFQALCSEVKKLLDVRDRLISKLSDNNLDVFEDQNDQKLYYSVSDRLDEFENKRCRVEGKIVTNKFGGYDQVINDNIFVVVMEIPSKGFGVPSHIGFFITERGHGRPQYNYVKNLKKGQTIKLHGAFFCHSIGSEYGIYDHQVIISKRLMRR